MKTKIIKTSFRLFSFLAEKTGGWRIFVQPKLWLGVLVLALVASCAETPETPETSETSETPEVTCYIAGPPSPS